MILVAIMTQAEFDAREWAKIRDRVHREAVAVGEIRANLRDELEIGLPPGFVATGSVREAGSFRYVTIRRA